ncbi:HD domain-containing phosphohydrolase [Pleionea sediminis]|uniref:HD domain-containing phosphohydrolase n=1 Tax=Pleionea sediminis TaxID=2569479 RepID=UPI001186C5A6|nr:HD domain-containing phosphohydrolase [Pleionea sediminis]
MDIEAICNEFSELDDEVKQEFYSDVKDCVQEINDCAAILSSEDPQVLINRLFRSIHTIKGNCNMVFLEPYVVATHKIEEMVQDVRNATYSYDPAYGKFFITCINALDEMLINTMANNIIDAESLQKLEILIETVRESKNEQRVEEALRGELAIQEGHYSLNMIAVSRIEGEAFSIFDATDMEFFHYLSECQQAIDPMHSLRMQVQIDIVKALNLTLSKPEEEDQLLAALYVFEFFHIVRGDDYGQNRRHVISAGNMLARIPGWTRAAELVFQSYEKTNGTGYPRGLSGNDISFAAKVIHLVDRFISIALDNRGKGYKKSLFIAVKSINQLADIEYPQSLINDFNQIIKEKYLDHVHW